ncbi:MAG TPA: DUF58 domain-containing protein [Gaiellaceae bacterium]|nr:DUF58 domain-containing protein [Gaiellaceae bacterium]
MSPPRRRAFPLVPRPRAAGVAYGALSSRRRGQGAEVAGTRRYVPGDRLASIDWYASARESMVRDDDIFIVRQYYAEMAPRVVVVVDRRPSVGLYPPDLPWLSKPAVIRETITAILAAARAARAYVGYLDFGSGHASPGEAKPHWIAPRRESVREIGLRVGDEFDASPASFELAVDYLLGLPGDVPAGTFVFVLSDFLEPLPDAIWSRVRAQRWDLVPVVIQDPVWEQSFPEVGGLVLPVVDPASRKPATLRLTVREARERREANAGRLEGLVERFRGIGFDPVVLGTADPIEIDTAFHTWAHRRRVTRRRVG